MAARERGFFAAAFLAWDASDFGAAFLDLAEDFAEVPVAAVALRGLEGVRVAMMPRLPVIATGAPRATPVKRFSETRPFRLKCFGRPSLPFVGVLLRGQLRS